MPKKLSALSTETVTTVRPGGVRRMKTPAGPDAFVHEDAEERRRVETVHTGGVVTRFVTPIGERGRDHVEGSDTVETKYR